MSSLHNRQNIVDYLRTVRPELFTSCVLIDGLSTVVCAGGNGDIDTTTLPETLWPASVEYPWQTAGFKAYIDSTSANDTAGGTGAGNVTLVGLDTSFNVQTEVVALSGLAGVYSVATNWLRINSVLAGDVGALGGNDGWLDIRVTNGAGVLVGSVVPQRGLSNGAFYTSPAGSSSYVTHVQVQMTTASTTTEVLCQLFTRTDGGPWIGRNVFALSANGTTYISEKLASPLLVPEKTDIEIRAIATNVDNTTIYGEMTIALLESWVREPLEYDASNE